MTEVLLEIKKGEKRYSGAIALHIAEFEAQAGGRIITFGPNGSGKSTLLRVVCGLTSLDIGTIKRTERWSELRIGYLPQVGGIYLDYTVDENQQMFSRLLGGCVEPESCQELSETLGLTPYLFRRADELSGGFRRLAALYAILTSKANVIALDEPFSSLDAEMREAVMKVLRAVDRPDGFLIVSEHESVATQLNNLSGWKEVQLAKP